MAMFGEALNDIDGRSVLLESGLASDTASVGLREVSLTALRALLPKPEFRRLMVAPAAIEGLVEVMIKGQQPSQEVAAYIAWDILVRPEADGSKLPIDIPE
eukprot:scaffold141613_cov42-Prasinocladus_malaysianus.AAC.2